MYRYNRPSERPPIEHGDYRRFLLECGDPDLHWVVAYGSNLDQSRLEARVGPVYPQVMHGALPDLRLVFNKRSGRFPDRGFANLQHAPGEETTAVAYRLTTEQMITLDGYEGVDSGHYLRVGLPFVHNSQRQTCQVYIAHPDHVDDTCTPTEDYLQHLRRGYEQHGFDPSRLP